MSVRVRAFACLLFAADCRSQAVHFPVSGQTLGWKATRLLGSSSRSLVVARKAATAASAARLCGATVLHSLHLNRRTGRRGVGTRLCAWIGLDPFWRTSARALANFVLMCCRGDCAGIARYA